MSAPKPSFMDPRWSQPCERCHEDRAIAGILAGVFVCSRCAALARLAEQVDITHDEALFSAATPVSPADVDAAAEWSIDAAMAQRAEDGGR